MLSESPSSDRVCLKLAQILARATQRSGAAQVGQGQSAVHLSAGTAFRGRATSGGSAVAARTAATRTPLLSNTFMRVKHASLFEAVKLGSSRKKIGARNKCRFRKSCRFRPRSAGNVMGVVQVSRKGLDASVAGADFTTEDLKLQLEQAAEILSACRLCRKARRFRL
jgi:hypothetical protein